MISLQDVKNLLPLSETIEYFTDIDVIPAAVAKELRQKLSDADLSQMEIGEIGVLHYNTLVSRVSVQGKNIVDAEIKSWLEEYNENVDKAILASEDMVKAYNAMVEAHFDAAIKFIKELEEKGEIPNTSFSPGLISAGSVSGIYNNLLEANYSESDAKKIVIGMMYEEAETPEQVKTILKGRMDYNKTIINLLQNMLKANHRILGITNEVANAMSADLESSNTETKTRAIKATREFLSKEMQNPKYKKNGYYDYREIGAGVLCIADGDLGELEEFRERRDVVLQKLLTNDIIVLGHGNTEFKDSRKDFAKASMKKMEEQKEKQRKAEKQLESLMGSDRDKNSAIIDKCDKLSDRINKKIDRLNTIQSALLRDYISGKLDAKSFDNAYNEYSKIIDRYLDLSNKLLARMRKAIDDKYAASREESAKLKAVVNQLEDEFNKTFRDFMEFERRKQYGDDDAQEWTIQEVKTPAGTFTKVVPMVEALIKAGFKKIYLMSCNPGGHKMPKHIEEMKDVRVTMGKNSVLAESEVFYDHDETDDIINDSVASLLVAERSLQCFCENSSIDYHNEEDLLESYQFVGQYFEQPTTSIVNEGSGAWATVFKLVGAVIKAVVYIFKKIIQMAASLINFIISRFRKDDKKGKHKFRKKVKIKVPFVENASMVTIEADSIEGISKIAEENVQKIAKAIQELERKQTENLSRYEKYIKKMAASEPKNESVTLTDLRHML